MDLSLSPAKLRRYKDIAALIIKYRRSELAIAPQSEARETGPRDSPDAEALASDLEELGPTFIKLGQILSTRGDFLPAPALEALSRLQDDVEPFDFASVEEIVTEELGVRLSKAFLAFDSEPVAAASLGQVHRAVLRDGRQVVVKVQRPGIRDRIVEDLEAFEDLAVTVDRHSEPQERYHLRDVIVEFRKGMLAELDYRREARHLLVLRRNLAEFPLIVVPQPITDYSTSRVLTMDYVAGVKITELSALVRIELDGEELVDTLMAAYLKQVFVDGFFHADPHPGNVFLTHDRRVALLDLGMVARVPPRLQQHLLQLVLAVADGRSEDAADFALKMSQIGRDFDEREFRRRVAELVGGNREANIAEMEVGHSFLQVSDAAAEAGLHPPPELTLLGKALLNLDQIGRTIAPHFDPNEAIRRHSMKILNQRMLKSLSPTSLFSGILEVKDLVERLPARVNRILDTLADNKMTFHVDTGIDAQQFMVGLQKVANRVSAGLILAALIVGAALLMRVETEFQILGYPGFAILCFAGAALGGLMLLYRTLRTDESADHGRSPQP